MNCCPEKEYKVIIERQIGFHCKCQNVENNFKINTMMQCIAILPNAPLEIHSCWCWCSFLPH